MSIMRLGDYIARIDYDDELETFHGRIINIRDGVNFYGRTPEELRQEFRQSLDVYLEVCAENGIEPEKPLSGRFNIRMAPEQHRRMVEAAEAEGKSLNAWALEHLDEAARHSPQ